MREFVSNRYVAGSIADSKCLQTLAFPNLLVLLVLVEHLESAVDNVVHLIDASYVDIALTSEAPLLHQVS